MRQWYAAPLLVSLLGCPGRKPPVVVPIVCPPGQHVEGGVCVADPVPPVVDEGRPRKSVV